MESQNITLSLPKDILRRAKKVAIDREISLSGLITAMIADLVNSEDRYEQARREHMALLARGFDLGGGDRPSATRAELHER